MISSLHINTEPTWRGGEQQQLYLMQGLRDRGHPVETAAQAGSPFAARCRREGFAVHELAMRGEADLAAVARLARLIRRGRFAVVHMHTSHAHTLGCLAAAWAGRARRVVSRRVDFSIFRRRFLGLNRLKYNLGPHRIVAISEAIRRVLLADGVASRLVTVVRSGIDFARLEPAAPVDLRREFDLPPAGPVLVNVAHLAGHKGQRFLVAAAPAVLERFPRARFLIVGEGEERPALEGQIRELGLEGRVILAGWRDDVPGILKGADLYVHASHLEGLGTIVLDALALARPVVAAGAGGVPEIVRDGAEGWLAPPADPAGLAAKINAALAAGEAERSRRARAGRERVRREFSVAGMVSGNLAVYSELVGG